MIGDRARRNCTTIQQILISIPPMVAAAAAAVVLLLMTRKTAVAKPRRGCRFVLISPAMCYERKCATLIQLQLSS